MASSSSDWTDWLWDEYCAPYLEPFATRARWAFFALIALGCLCFITLGLTLHTRHIMLHSGWTWMNPHHLVRHPGTGAWVAPVRLVES